MIINRVEEIAEASKTIVQRDVNTWVGVWYDYKTHALYTTQELKQIEDSSHAYAVGQLIRPNTAEEVKQMVQRWMYM